jgi:hypothetical protein
VRDRTFTQMRIVGGSTETLANALAVKPLGTPSR